MVAPAFTEAEIEINSANSSSLTPACFAPLIWTSIQYEHCVVSATAKAINSLVFIGIFPSLRLMVLWSKSINACVSSGAYFNNAAVYLKSLLD
nr:hypothetical protein [Snodgrassella alvi]